MKKIITALFVVTSAAFAHASYLYWQVDASDFANQTFNGNTISGFNLVAIKAGETYSSSSANRHILDSYSFDAATEDYSIDNSPVGWSTATTGANYADVSTYNTGYTYYVEIVGSSGLLGQSQTGLTYEQASTSGNIVSTLGGTAISQVSAQMWQGGNAYAVPEPTGAMLMIFGLAMLGLKRRKV